METVVCSAQSLVLVAVVLRVQTTPAADTAVRHASSMGEAAIRAAALVAAAVAAAAVRAHPPVVHLLVEAGVAGAATNVHVLNRFTILLQ
jgi:hypothetical protein